MMSIIVIALSLSSGNGAASVASMNTTIQAPNGDYVVTYQGPKSTHAPKRNAAHFTSDEGNNGALPMVAPKHL